MTDSPPDSGSTPKPRGLWSIISQSSEPVSAESEAEAKRESPSKQSAGTSPQSLFEIMRRAEAAEIQSVLDALDPADRTNKYLIDETLTETIAQPSLRPVTVREVEVTPAADVEPVLLEVAQTIAPQEGENVLQILAVIQAGDDRSKPARRAAAKRLRQSSTCFLCGLASIGLSALSMRPEVWIGIPSSVLGFFAIVLGYLTLTGVRLNKLSSFTTIASQSGMLLGTLGMFLGPLVFAGLGRDLRESKDHQLTRKHLGVIGKGLQEFHDRNGAYPVGGTFIREPSGALQGQHGWMTFLLPFIGERALYSSIDQSQPFDAPENREAMGHDVEAYFAAGADRTKLGQSYSVTHFAGLGGDVKDETGTSHAGIFTRDTAIRQADVTDGLANTLIVGEVAGGFAPWGDPENWRTIGRGLNKNANGFGNAAGSGAMFLFGDGSVRMFSNKTDPKLLRQLSSRDGGE